MSHRLRVNKNGERVYEIKISRGRDPVTGKQITPYRKTWHFPQTWSDKRAEKEVAIVEGEFRAECMAGKVLTKQEEIQQRKVNKQKANLEALKEANKPTYEQYVKIYLEKIKAQGLAKTTIHEYTRALNLAIETFSGVKMEDITSEMLRTFFTKMQNEKQYKWLTMRYRYAVFKAFFNTAEEQEIIEHSPMSKIKAPRKPKDEKEKPKAFNEEQLQYILQCAAQEPFERQAMLIFMLDTGCRRGEVAGMKWKNIDLNTGELTVCVNREYTPEDGVYETTPKSGKGRKIFLTEYALGVMKRLKREQAERLFRRGTHTEYCFCNRSGEALSPYAIESRFRRFKTKYQIPNFHPHALRHTMATISIANGADIVSVSKKLGHANPSITLNVYSHANEEAQKRATELYGNAIYRKMTHKKVEGI